MSDLIKNKRIKSNIDKNALKKITAQPVSSSTKNGYLNVNRELATQTTNKVNFY